MNNPVMKVAAIHDLSGFGRASLTVVTPILSAMGIQVVPLPTAVLSTHSKFPDFRFIDLTDKLPDIVAHWKELNLEFDAIYSGFLGSPTQVDIVSDLITSFKEEDQLVMVDPVMGDDGRIYKPFTPEMVGRMRELVGFANIITPNMTEAALLLGEKFTDSLDDERIKKWLTRLTEMGPRTAIITSVPFGETPDKTRVVALDRKSGRFWQVKCNYLPATYPGTGDAFASVVCGSLLTGDSLPIALDRAVSFTSMGVRATFGYDYDTRQGILLERVLPTLNQPVSQASYEMI